MNLHKWRYWVPLTGIYYMAIEIIGPEAPVPKWEIVVNGFYISSYIVFIINLLH